MYGNHKILLSHHGCSYYYYYYIYIYIYIYIYVYIYNCSLSFLHAFVMCYLPKLKRGMASFFLNIF